MLDLGSNGMAKTLNGCGWMQVNLDYYSHAFLEFIPNAPGKILEIGAAYGVVTVEAVKLRRPMLVNDLDAGHLKILMSRIPTDLREYVTLIPGYFPDEVPIEEMSLGAVYASRVLHFLDGPALERGVHKLFSALAPGGKAFVTVVTPFNKRYFPTMMPIYEERIRKGQVWPGFFTSVKSIVTEEHREFVPDFVHIFTLESIVPVFVKAGFDIEKADYIARPEFSPEYQLDGREDIGLICRKPAVERW